MTAPMSGTAATNRPAMELERCCSALESRTQGTASSTVVYTNTQRQRANAGRSSPRRRATGASSSAAGNTRKNTSAGGESSRTATRMSK